MLDTNALSAWADADVALLRVLPKDRLWHLPVVALGEFLFGIRRSRERAKLERWMEEVKATCALVSVDADTAGHYADIREELRVAATPIPENDIWKNIRVQKLLPIINQQSSTINLCFT